MREASEGSEDVVDRPEVRAAGTRLGREEGAPEPAMAWAGEDVDVGWVPRPSLAERREREKDEPILVAGLGASRSSSSAAVVVAADGPPSSFVCAGKGDPAEP